MKITKKILKRRAKRELKKAISLDLSGLGIGAIEELQKCSNLQILDLSHNSIEEVEGIRCCQHLWNINFSHNELSSLTELSHFYAFGTVDLSFNNLSWKELARIQDVIILDLHLHGNPTLEKDMYYRIHVIDCLPNIWMLDGRIITSAERLQVQQFFQESALSSHPVRRKLCDRPLTSRQRMNAGSIHGCRTSKFVSKFARNEIHSSDTDLRRLAFLFENMQDDFSVVYDYDMSKMDVLLLPDHFLWKIIDQRQNDRERCNVLLLLLLASLEFQLPTDLLTETLRITQLDTYAGVDATLLFALERHWRIRLASLLLSASKLDRDMCVEGSGGLYDRLYLCLYYLVSDLVKFDWKNWKRKSSTSGKSMLENSQKKYLSSYLRPQTAPALNIKEALHSKHLHRSREEHRMLLASEIILLLSVVPSFYKHIENDPSMQALLQTAANDTALTEKIIAIAKNARQHGGDLQQICKEISDHSMQQIERATLGIRLSALQQFLFPTPHNKYMPTNETRSEWKIILNTKNAYPRRPKSAVLTSGEVLTSGRRRTYADMQRGFNIKSAPVYTSAPASEPKLSLGGNILLGPQNMSRVIAMPESNIALVQMNSVPAPNGSVIIQSKNDDDHYCYVDVKQLEHDPLLGCWKPRGTIGDKVTLQATAETKQKTASLSRIPDALIFDREHSRQGGEMRSRRSSVSGKRSATPRSIFSRQGETPLVLIDDSAGLNELLSNQEQPPRPLSALFKEKMNLRLPVQSSDMWTETDSQNLVDEPVTLPSTPMHEVPHVMTGLEMSYPDELNAELEQQRADVEESQDLGKEKVEIGLSGDQVEDTEALRPMEGPEIQQVELVALQLDDQELEMEEKQHTEDHDELNSNALEPELQALNDEQPKEDTSIMKRNRASDLRKRAISARQPKHAKIVSSDTRPASAVTRARDLRSRGGHLYRDDVEMDRPDSVSSFQLERTEAWRSSASSSMNVPSDQKSPKQQPFGFMSVPENRRTTSFHVVALRPTPPQRPSSPSHNPSSKKQDSEDKSQGSKTPVIMNASKDKGIKLASNWLADGRDLHEEYKKTRVYMSPHVPGYLDGIISLPPHKKNMNPSLPLTASLNAKLEKLSAIRSSKRSSVPAHLHEYLPPGIGVPDSGFKTRFSALGDMKQLVGRYPAVSLMKPKKK